MAATQQTALRTAVVVTVVTPCPIVRFRVEITHSTRSDLRIQRRVPALYQPTSTIARMRSPSEAQWSYHWEPFQYCLQVVRMPGSAAAVEVRPVARIDARVDPVPRPAHSTRADVVETSPPGDALVTEPRQAPDDRRAHVQAGVGGAVRVPDVAVPADVRPGKVRLLAQEEVVIAVPVHIDSLSRGDDH